MARGVLSNIKMRRANNRDCLDIFKWRNDPETRKNSILNTKKISPEEHMRWFGSKVKDPNTRLYMAVSGNSKVGLMRFHIDKNSVLVGVNVNPLFRGMGIGTKIIGLATSRVFREIKRPIIAEVKNRNTASRKAFAKNGYVVKRKTKKITYMCFEGAEG